VVFLKQPDSGNSRGSRLQALPGVFQGDSAQGENGHRRRGGDRSKANLPQLLQACRVLRADLFEHRGKHRKVGSMGLCVGNIGGRMDGYGNQRRGDLSAIEDGADLASLEVIAGQVHAVRAAGQSDVCPRVDEQPGLGSSQRSFCLLRQLFQRARAQLLFAQLDVIHPGRRTFGDLLEQPALLLSCLSRKLPPIGDVVELRTHRSSIVTASGFPDGGQLWPRNSPLLKVSLTLQLVWLFVLAIPIAAISWTVTHEEIVRELRDYCLRQSDAHPRFAVRKFYFIFTCEYCFSHYVTILFLFITGYKLLYQDWRGYLIAGFALVWIANQYMSIYAHVRLDIRKDRAEIKHVEKKVEEMEERRIA